MYVCMYVCVHLRIHLYTDAYVRAYIFTCTHEGSQTLSLHVLPRTLRCSTVVSSSEQLLGSRLEISPDLQGSCLQPDVQNAKDIECCRVRWFRYIANISSRVWHFGASRFYSPPASRLQEHSQNCSDSRLYL